LKATVGIVARNLSWLVAGEAVVKAGLFAAGVVIARGLGAAAMGAFTVAYGAALVLMLGLAAGQVEVLIREVARAPSSARVLGRKAAAWQNRVAVVVLPLAFVACLLVSSPVLRWTLVAFLPYAFLRARLITVGGVFKGLDRMEVEALGRTVEVAVALVLLLITTRIAAAAWSTGVAFSIGALAGLTLVTGRLRTLAAAGEASRTRSWLAREGAAFLALGLASQVLLRLDTFALAALGTTEEAIGQYGVASAPVWGLLGVALLLAAAIYPTLSRAADAGGLRGVRVLGLGLGGAALGAVLGAALFAVREPIVRLVFGPAYHAAVPLLAVLAWALPGAFGATLLGVAVAACGRQAWALAWQVAALLLAVAAFLFVIPRFGLAGCALVTVAAHGASLVAMLAIAVAAARRPAAPSAVAPVAE
jgi:O-antigen/teichoic acid export membrane protein